MASKLKTLANDSSASIKVKTERDRSVKKQLRELYPSQKGEKYFPKSRAEKDHHALSDRIEGRWINTAFGDIFRAEYTQSLEESYGDVDLRDIQTLTSDFYKDTFSFDTFTDLKEMVFIDTETTGLSGGTGTVAFMVGIAWFTDDAYVVHQYFISELSHEEGMLDLLKKDLDSFACLVSFNGKSYDIPLLNTRFIMNHITPLPETLPHMDLLHPVRALWKYSLFC